MSNRQQPQEAYDKAIQSYMAYLQTVQPQPHTSSQASQQQSVVGVRQALQSRLPSQPPFGQQMSIPEAERADLHGAFPTRYGQRTGRGRRATPSRLVHAVPSVKTIEFNFCLLPESTSNTPVDDIQLLQAGLGRRIIPIPTTAGHDEIERLLLAEYPKMKSITGDWMLHKSSGGGGQRKLVCILHASQGYTANYLKSNSNNGKNLLYIIPIQTKLDMTPLSPDAHEFAKMPKAVCKLCGVTMPLQLLAAHVDACVSKPDQGGRDGGDSDSDIVEVPADNLATWKPDNLKLETCPVCGLKLPPDLILFHASACGDTGQSEQEHGTPNWYNPASLGAENAGPSHLMPNNMEAERTEAESTVPWSPDQQEHTGPSNAIPAEGETGPPLTTKMDLWKTETNPQTAAAFYRIDLLEKKEDERPLRASLDLGEDQQFQTSSIISFYKGINVDWARPLHCKIHGDEAVGIGVNRHFLSFAMSKLQHGFNFNSGVTDISLLFEGEEDHLIPSTLGLLADSDLFVVAGRIIGHCFLHEGPQLHGLSDAIVHVLLHNDDTATIQLADVADLEIRAILQKLDGHEDLTAEETDKVNDIAKTSWELPPLSETNRRWMFQALLQREVIWRRKTQIKQLRRGLKDTKVLELLMERPDVVPLVFPQSADVILCATDIFANIVWPGGAGLADDSDSDDEDCPQNLQDRTTGFLPLVFPQSADVILCATEILRNIVWPGGAGLADEHDEDDYPQHLRDRTTGFLRRFIETASPETLQQLVKFWVGLEIPSSGMKVTVGRNLYLKKGICLTDSTCFQTLHVPGHFHTYEGFCDHIKGCIATSEAGFGHV